MGKRATTVLIISARAVVFVLAAAFLNEGAYGQSAQGQATLKWKPVSFAIVRYNEDAPKSWSLYHSEKRGVLLLRLWKRYLVVDVPEREVFDVDPQKVKITGDSAELSEADIPDDPVETSEWRTRDAGPVQRIRFRFGSDGNFLEIQVPMRADGKPAY